MNAPKRRRWVKFALLGASGSALGTLALAGFFLLVVVSLLPSLVGSLTGPGGTGFQTLSEAPPVVPRTAVATQAQEQFAGDLVACSHLDSYVALGWTLAEGGGVNSGQPAYNFLFLTAPGGGFREFASSEEAAAAVCSTLRAPDYAGLLSAAQTATPLDQVLAIAESPWDGGHVAWGDPAGHYGGRGQNLLSAYYGVLGTSYCSGTRGPC